MASRLNKFLNGFIGVFSALATAFVLVALAGLAIWLMWNIVIVRTTSLPPMGLWLSMFAAFLIWMFINVMATIKGVAMGISQYLQLKTVSSLMRKADEDGKTQEEPDLSRHFRE